MAESTSGEFFARNSQLFTVMGVFGVISVYFTQLNVESRWRRLGIVSSLTIFILVAITIQKNVSPPSSDQQPFDFIINRVHRRRGLTVFYVAFYAVVLSVVAIVLQFSNTLLFLFQFLFLIAGFGTIIWSIDRIGQEQEETWVIGKDPQFLVYAAYLVRNGMFGLIFGGGVLALVWLQGVVSVQQLTEFQVSSMVTAFVVGFSSGLVVAGLLYVLMVPILILFHILFRRFEGHDVLEWYEELVESSISDGEEEEK